MENKQLENDKIKEATNSSEPQEKEYYTKKEVEELIANKIINSLGDFIVKLNENSKPKEEPKQMTKDDYRF